MPIGQRLRGINNRIFADLTTWENLPPFIQDAWQRIAEEFLNEIYVVEFEAKKRKKAQRTKSHDLGYDIG